MESVTLYEALRVSAPEEEWREYQESTVNRNDFMSLIAAAVKTDAQAAASSQKKVGRSLELRRQFEATVKQKLASGELVASGYAAPRKIEDQKADIPLDVWNGLPSVNWESGTVKGNGLDFIEVVVESGTGKREPTPPRKKRGRPALHPFFKEAFDALVAAGAVDFDQPKTATHNPLVEWLAKEYPEKAGDFRKASEATIRLAIQKKFDRAKCEFLRRN